MPAPAAFYLSSPVEIVIVTGAVLAGCVGGVSMFLCWLDKQVPSLPVILFFSWVAGFVLLLTMTRSRLRMALFTISWLYGSHLRVGYAAMGLGDIGWGIGMDGL